MSPAAAVGQASLGTSDGKPEAFLGRGRSYQRGTIEGPEANRPIEHDNGYAHAFS